MDREQALKAHAERTRAEIDWANNPHEFYVRAFHEDGHQPRLRYGVFNTVHKRVDRNTSYASFDEASDAIGEMIADDDADRRLHRNRHEACEP